jgi:uncharacterized protein (TIGR02147 family)
MELKSIYDYIDYRQYLHDYYLYHKTKDSEFSYRFLAKMIGFSSPNFVKLVIDGQRNIGKESLPKIIDALGLKKKEAEYFSYLVL